MQAISREKLDETKEARKAEFRCIISSKYITAWAVIRVFDKFIGIGPGQSFDYLQVWRGNYSDELYNGYVTDTERHGMPTLFDSYEQADIVACEMKNRSGCKHIVIPIVTETVVLGHEKDGMFSSKPVFGAYQHPLP